MNERFPDGKSLAILSNSIAVALSERLDLESQNVLGNLFTLIGASLLSIAAVNQAIQSAAESSAANTGEKTAQEQAYGEQAPSIR